MSVSTITPNSTISSTGITLTGAASAHAALNDSSDSSYVTIENADSFRVGFGDFTLPAAAVIKSVRLDLRDKKIGSNTKPTIATLYLPAATLRSTESYSPSWTTFTTHSFIYTPASMTELAEADIDGAELALTTEVPAGGHGTVFAEADLQVTYVTQPAVNATAPTGTVSATNTPTVTWDDTLDSDGGAQTFYEVKVFTAAQYGAGGFNPASSTPTETSGVIAGADTSWAVANPLADATYRAYVRVGQTVLGSTHWSDWDYIGFIMSTSPPAAPTIAVTADSLNAHLTIAVTANTTPDTDNVEVQRSTDGGTTWETIRSLNDGVAPVAADHATVHDYEVGNGISARYRARGVNNSGVTSAWSTTSSPVSWSSTSWWIKSLSYPELNMPVTVASQAEYERPIRRGVFEALGRPDPIVVNDSRSTARGEIRLDLDADGQEDLDLLLDLLQTLLIQAPPTDSWPDRYVAIGDQGRERSIDKAFSARAFDTLPWIEVASPPGDVTAWPTFGS